MDRAAPDCSEKGTSRISYENVITRNLIGQNKGLGKRWYAFLSPLFFLAMEDIPRFFRGMDSTDGLHVAKW